MRQNKWTREELIITFNLYCKIPFGRIHIRNPQIIQLAKALGRTPSAVSWKLANFARLDPSLQKRNIRGASHGSKTEEEIWHEFSGNWNDLAFESERLLAAMMHKTIEQTAGIELEDLPREGKERESIVKVRVNQQFFRKAVLAAYDFKCCVTRIPLTDLLNASHIVPWATDPINRINPRNGVCLNAIHDRAFDRGLITITPDYKVELSRMFSANEENSAMQNFFLRYKGQQIFLPSRFVPDVAFLKYHNERIFLD